LKQTAIDVSRKSISADASANVAAVNSPEGISAEKPVSTATSTSLEEPFGRFPSPSDLANHVKVLAFFNQLLMMMTLLLL
jgi:hypothetical protein